MKIKVIEFLNAMVDGGAETLVKDYARMLDNDRFDVSVMCIYNVTDTANAKHVRENGTNMICVFPNHGIIQRIYRKLFGHWYIPYFIKKTIRIEKPDVIHIHMRNLKYFAKIHKALKGIRLLYTCHNLPELMFDEKSECEAAELLIHKCNLKMIALHEEMKNKLDDMFHIDTTTVVLNGIDMQRFKNVIQSKASLRKQLSIPQDAFVMGNIGRMSEQKNQMILIDILHELRSRGNNAYLMLVGSGPLEGALREKAETMHMLEFVCFLSHRTDIPELLKTMDVFVFPSIFEGLSVTMVEAQTAGIRCVISDKINPETILSSRTIVVSLECSTSEWADIIVDESLLNKTYGDIDRFDMKNAITKLEKLYNIALT